MKVRCKKCKKKWDYKDKNKFYATCPDCKTSVKIDINKGAKGEKKK